MKIRLAILEKDEVYLKRLESVFNVKYADKLEIYTTTDREFALQSLQDKRIDVFLADETFDIETALLPSNCGFAYLVDTVDIERVRDAAAVCKFQKAETIYRQILGLFSEKTAAVLGTYTEGEGGKALAFVSAAGGTGSSVAAAACAMYFAQKGKKALYLNLEKFGSADVFFQAEGNAGLGDVIYAVKSRKGNLAMKLESTVKRDASGVFFYSSTRLALDIAELSADETRQIVNTLKTSGGYDYIVLDIDFSMEKDMLKILEECNTIVFVADGSAASNVKLERVVASLHVLEQQTDQKLLPRCGILYNRFSSHTSHKAQVSDLKEFGGINRYEGFDTDGLLQQLKDQQVFETFL
ncbi:MAG: chromosome partitioning protein ParA [Acetatifactor sp.]